MPLAVVGLTGGRDAMRNKIIPCALAAMTVFLLLHRGAPAAQKPVASEAKAGTTETGIAIFYSDSMQGRPLTSGEKYDKNALTAAHRTLPLGSMVKVTNLKNNKSVVVKINDRGPHGSKQRIIDLSRRAAEELEMVRDGKAKVKLEAVQSR
jgi:rare lipoprotein A